MPPSRYSKRGDTWEPVTGVASDANGPVDLRGATLRFLAVAQINSIKVYIDSNVPAHGPCVNVEDISANVADRGRYRYEMAIAGVSAAGLFKCELEAIMPNGKVITWPSREANNPEWQIDSDINPPVG